jgi:hypothetical protein
MALKALRFEDVDYIYLTQDRYQWRTVINKEMNLEIPKKKG